MYSDWCAISQNSSRNSARTYRIERNDKCIASFRFAYDLALFANTPNEMKVMIEKPNQWGIETG